MRCDVRSSRHVCHVALVLVDAEVLLAADGTAVLHLTDDVALGAEEPRALDVLLGVVDVPGVVVVADRPSRASAEDEVQVGDHGVLS